ncbi:2511_t:CDS:2, partial [Racocetra fulgida]
KQLNSFLCNHDKYYSDLMSHFVKQHPELKELQPINVSQQIRNDGDSLYDLFLEDY